MQALSGLLIKVIVHEESPGSGGNQKFRYKAAPDLGATVSVMLDPDYQHTPNLIRAMPKIVYDDFHFVPRSQILRIGAPKGEMPV